MRGIVVLILMVFAVGAVMLAAGPVVEDLNAYVSSNDAVQGQGWGNIPGEIQTSVLDYTPRIFIVGMIGWAAVWYLRKEQVVGGR